MIGVLRARSGLLIGLVSLILAALFLSIPTDISDNIGDGLSFTVILLGISVSIVLIIYILYQVLTRPLVTWGAYFLAISLTGSIIQVGPVLVRPEMYAFPLIIAIFWSRKYRSSESRLGSNFILVAVLMVLFALVALTTTVLHAPVISSSLWILFQIVMGFVSFLYFVSMDTNRERFIAIGTIVIGSIASLSILSWLAEKWLALPNDLAFGVASDHRLIGFSFETNIFASQCVGWIAVMAVCRHELSRPSRIFGFVIVAAVILAGTRAAWIALIIIVCFLAVVSIGRFMITVPFGLLFAVFMFLVLSSFDVDDMSSRESLTWRLLNLLSTDTGTGAYRVGIYDTAISDIDTFRRALVGTGLNTFSQFHPVDPTNVASSYLSSVWYATIYDTGILGFFLFFGIFISIIWQASARMKVFLVIITLLICASATNLVWFQYAWVYIALVAGGRTINEKNNSVGDSMYKITSN